MYKTFPIFFNFVIQNEYWIYLLFVSVTVQLLTVCTAKLIWYFVGNLPPITLGHTVHNISAVEKKPLNFVDTIFYRQCLNQNKCKRIKAEVIYLEWKRNKMHMHSYIIECEC